MTDKCWVCRKPVSDLVIAKLSHFRKHVNEGILTESKPRPRKTLPMFRRKTEIWWGYVSKIEAVEDFVSIVSIRDAPILKPMPMTIVLDRWRVEGIPEIGMAVRIRFKRVKDYEMRGSWFATPLDYIAEWIDDI